MTPPACAAGRHTVMESILQMEFTGVRKVAAFLLSLDTQTAASLLAQFSEDEIGAITREMLHIGTLKHDVIQEVQHEFIELAAAGEDFIPDTRSIAETLIKTVIGEERGRDIIGGSESPAMRIKPFEGLVGADPRQIAEALAKEHAQTIAQVLAHLKPQQAGQVLSLLPHELQSDVVLRMTHLEKASQDLLERLDAIMLSRVGSEGKGGVTTEFRNKRVAEILNVVNKDIRKQALEDLAREAPESAREIEGLMFVFEDFMMVDDGAIRKVIMEVDNDTLAVALKTASPELKGKFLKNLSKRAASMVEETLEYLGPKPLSEVEAAQRELMQQARLLEDQGEIVLRRGEEEQLV